MSETWERKQMHHSSGSVRIYRTYESGNMDDGGRCNADQGKTKVKAKTKAKTRPQHY